MCNLYSPKCSKSHQILSMNELVANINRELHKANNNSFFMAFLLSVEWLLGLKISI